MKKTLIIIAVIATALTGLNGQNKTELVIGNGAYRNNFAELANPVPEAELMVRALGGLTRLDTPTNSIVVYSADSGQVARDGLFTPILLEYLTEPGLSLNQVLMQTRREVYRRSNGGRCLGSTVC